MFQLIPEKKEDGLVLHLDGKVDTSNAQEVEEACFKARRENPDGSVTIDADGLQYISSAGLRVILKFRKAEPTLKIIDVSSDVYEVFEMTGFSELIPVSKAFRTLSVEGCEVIGKGAKGTVYRYDPETVVKVFNDPNILPRIQRERQLARKAFILGIPTAISYDVVRVGDKYGSVFELLNAKNYSTLIRENPDKVDAYAKVCGGILKQVHETEVDASEMPDAKDTAYVWLSACEKVLSPEDQEKLRKLVDDIPDRSTMIHGDFHSNNVMDQNGEAILIDMDTLSHGYPTLELANIYTCYVAFGEAERELLENFLGFSVETAKKFWYGFLRAYLNTEDESRIETVTQKAALLAYSRTISHFMKRGAADTAEGRSILDNIGGKLSLLIRKTDSLLF